MKKLALLGSTGSIGTQALDVVRCIQKEGDGAVEVTALAAHSNIRLLEAQIREFKPQAVAVFDLQAAEQLRAAVRDCDVRVYSGMEGLCALAALEEADIVLNSVVGMVGLEPTLAALRAKKQLALANKETLVAGGALDIGVGLHEVDLFLQGVDLGHQLVALRGQALHLGAGGVEPAPRHQKTDGKHQRRRQRQQQPEPGAYLPCVHPAKPPCSNVLLMIRHREALSFNER